MSGMDDLIAFLRAQLDEDERKVAAMEREATRVQTAPIFQSHPPNWLASVDIFVSPKRWRAEVEAKRRMLDLAPAGVMHALGTQDPDFRDGYMNAHEDVIKLIAQPYAGRPGWREEWAS